MRNRAKETGLHGPFFFAARPGAIRSGGRESGSQGANRHFFAVSGKS